MTIDAAILHSDGGSRGNPGKSGIGFTIGVDSGRDVETICHGGWFIGEATNNVAEYRALIWGLENAIALNVRKLAIYADSELMVKQLNGAYRVKNEGIKPLFACAKELLDRFPAYTITHVLREHNAAPDALANEAMDTGGPVGDFKVPFSSGDLFSLTGEAQASEEMKGSGMYRLTVKDHFDAAHSLVGYPGECRNLHGHTWDIEVSVEGTELDEIGILYDFKDLKHDLKKILDRFDHAYLNEVEPFDTMNTTAENLARVIYDELEMMLVTNVRLVEVCVWESPIAKLAYRR